jgi:hypothetical protein
LQYSLDNEAERQKLELRAQRVQLEMEQKLGTSGECLRRREERFQTVKRVEQEIETLNEAKRTAVTMATESEPPVATRRTVGPNPGPGRQHAVPRSANLEQLYHQALPMDKALSHSGPPIFGNVPFTNQVKFYSFVYFSQKGFHFFCWCFSVFWIFLQHTI